MNETSPERSMQCGDCGNYFTVGGFFEHAHDNRTGPGMTQKRTEPRTEFLLARIAEDEAAIKARDLHRPIHFVGCYYYDNIASPADYCDCDGDGAASRRLLAECEAKRQIVEKCGEILAVDGWEYDDAPNLADTTLCLLALPYADHPDYREEWRP